MFGFEFSKEGLLSFLDFLFGMFKSFIFLSEKI